MLTALERLRLTIADRERLVLHEVVGLGDSLTLAFQTRGAPVVVGSETIAVVSTASGGIIQVFTPGAGYTIDYRLGLIRFSSPPAVDDEVRVSYRWFAFSDEELSDILLRSGGDVSGAAILALQMVLADTDRFIRYTLGQETVDRAAARDAITALLDLLKADRGGMVGMVQADTPYRECLMYPFLEQKCND